MYPFSTDRSISELLGHALTELSKLIQTEFAIARIEMSDKAAGMIDALKLIGAGAALALAGLVVILMAIAAALTLAGLPNWAADLCSGGGAAIIGFVLVLVGLGRFSSKSLTPSATLEQLRQDRLTAKALSQ